jgi:hypothetical protein
MQTVPLSETHLTNSFLFCPSVVTRHAQVCLAYIDDKTYTRAAPGWSQNHGTLLQLLEGSLTSPLTSTDVAFRVLDNLTEKDSVTVSGIAQSLT